MHRSISKPTDTSLFFSVASSLLKTNLLLGIRFQTKEGKKTQVKRVHTKRHWINLDNTPSRIRKKIGTRLARGEEEGKRKRPAL